MGLYEVPRRKYSSIKILFVLIPVFFQLQIFEIWHLKKHKTNIKILVLIIRKITECGTLKKKKISSNSFWEAGFHGFRVAANIFMRTCRKIFLKFYIIFYLVQFGNKVTSKSINILCWLSKSRSVETMRNMNASRVKKFSSPWK